MHKPEPAGDSGGGLPNKDGLIEIGNENTNCMQLNDGIPLEENRKISREENDIHDDADGEADDDEERYRLCSRNFFFSL